MHITAKMTTHTNSEAQMIMDSERTKRVTKLMFSCNKNDRITKPS